jgi:hypothetical protein
MTNFTKNLMLAAAACALAAGTAAAQSYQAEVPFSFRAGSTSLAPGEYSISMQGITSGKLMVVRNLDTHNSIMVQTVSMTGESKGPAAPTLRFVCWDKRCALESVWVGGYQGAFKLHVAPLGPRELARIETVELARGKAE